MTRVREQWASRTVWAGITAFTATTGALLAFAYARGGMFVPFARIGRRVALNVALPYWGDTLVGMVVHLGQSLALGALTVLLAGAWPAASRLRAALLVVLCWQLATIVPWLAVIRVDLSVELSPIARLGLAVLLVAALAMGQGKRATQEHAGAEP